MTAAPPNPASQRDPTDAGRGLRMVVRRLAAIPADPLALLGATGPAFAWADPTAGVVLVGAGAVAELVGDTPEELARLLRAADPVEQSDQGPPVRWLGGFSFDGRADVGWAGFPAAWLFLPAALLTIDAGTAWLGAIGPDPLGLEAALDAAEEQLRRPRSAGRTPAVVATEEGPSMADRVRQALDEIGAASVDKVVVSTRRRLTLAGPADPADALAAAAGGEPSALQFLVRSHGRGVWLGASPERLVSVSGQAVVAMALAGTIARGRDGDEDGARAKELMASVKDRREHEWVVDALRKALADGDATASWVPRVRRLSRMFHLETEVTATRPDGAGLLDIAARLHPTPALAGSPRREALELVARIEPEGRGWYGGAVGWATPDGDGDLAVGIRGALVDGDVVTGFAGAGVVADSDPSAEEREASMKLDSALAPFYAPSGRDASA